MTKRKLSILCLIGLLLSSAAIAQDTEVNAAVAASIQKDQDIWVGQQITLNLDLKTTGFSFSDTHFNLPDVGNAFLMQTDSTTIKITQKIDGQDWQILRYPLALFPQQSGKLEVPPIDVRFSSSAGYGTTQKRFEFSTEPLELTVKLPPGTNKAELIVTTSSFALEHQWQPASDIVKTGDAFTLVVKRTADDISAMLLPPLPVFTGDGLAAYPQTPEISDKSIRGDLVGERIDKVTWVVEKPGSYKMPGIRFQWWDPQTSELNHQLVPGIEFEAISSSSQNVAESTGTSDNTVSGNIRNLIIAAFVFLAAVALWIRFRTKPGSIPAANEKTTFMALQKACKGNHPGQTYAAIHAWLPYCSPAIGKRDKAVTFAAFARSIEDEQMALELEKLQQAIVSPVSNWQGEQLLTRLKSARRKMETQKIAKLKPDLAPLNPASR